MARHLSKCLSTLTVIYPYDVGENVAGEAGDRSTMSKVTVPIDTDEFDDARIVVDTETGKITAWNRRTGREYDYDYLAPHTGEEGPR